MTATNRISSDPYRAANDTSSPTGTGPGTHTALDNEWQPDLQLAEGPASNSRIAVFAVAIAVVLGVVFYGLNSSNVEQSGTSSIAQTAAPPTTTADNSAQPPAPPAAATAENTSHPAATPLDKTPRTNTEPGMTTGAASGKSQTPPASAPTGPDMNKSGNPPTNPTTSSTTK